MLMPFVPSPASRPRHHAWASSLRLAAIVVCALGATAATAQEIPTVPARTPKEVAATVTCPAASPDCAAQPLDLERLTTSYLSGDWDAFGERARRLLTRVLAACQAPVTVDETTGGVVTPRACWSSQDFVQLFWIGSITTPDTPTIFSAILGPGISGYSRVVPGLQRAGATDDRPRLVEVFVDPRPETAVSFSTYYISKPVPDPLLTQAPAAVEKFLGPLFTTLAVTMASTDPTAMVDAPPSRAPSPPLTAIVRRVELPTSRASVEVQSIATRPLQVTPTLTQIAALTPRLTSLGLSDSAAATEFIAQVSAEFASQIVGTELTPPNPACAGPNSTPSGCRDDLHLAVTRRVSAMMGRSGSTPADADLIKEAAKQFRAFIDGLKPQTITAKATLDNSPETKFSLGIGTALAGYRGPQRRAKIDKNVVTADPLPRSLQMVMLNITPWGYQDKSTARWRKDAFVRPYLGVVFSPTFGPTAGVSFMLLSNLGVNVGYARLVIARPEDGLTIGDDLTAKDGDRFRFADELRDDPLQRGYRHAWYLGASYNFK